MGELIHDIKKKSPDDDQDVIIEDAAWYCIKVTILKEVTVGRGAVIAAGAVVSANLPTYTIIGGVRAEHLKNRFSSKAEALRHENDLFGSDPLQLEQINN